MSEFKKLTTDGREFLSCVHSVDVFKVLKQVEVISKQISQIEELQEFSQEKCDRLVILLKDYYEVLDKIPLENKI